MTEQRKRIVVAMSGGVDSSVAAALLHSQGHDVIGVTLQLYDQGAMPKSKKACCAGQDIYDAARVAEKIGIPHYVLDYESIFKQEVIEDFADSYLRGETPIPCVRCNQSVKFRDLFKVAKNLNADALATGHYVRIVENNGKKELHKGVDLTKDQSYFLFATTQEQIDFLHLPIGEFDKTYTRQLATKFQLEIANKPDSQDICFVPDGSYANVISRLRPNALDSGDIIDKGGNILGKHEGIINFTVGQRRGIGISSEKPLYVIKIIPETKSVVVGGEEDLYDNSLNIKEINWLGDSGVKNVECEVKLRSMQKEIAAKVNFAENGMASVSLKTPYRGITPGQACVMYSGTRMLGGGWITGVNN